MLKFDYDTSCPTCGEQFARSRNFQIYCSAKCRLKWGRLKNKNILAVKPPRVYPDAECALCGKVFAQRKPWAKYCSGYCRHKVFKQNEKQHDK